MSFILVDPGHGMGNRQPGSFDPGIVSTTGAKEADWTLAYGRELVKALLVLGCGADLTRLDNQMACPLASRLAEAHRLRPDLLVSVHFNGDAVPGDAMADGRVKGFEVMWRTPASKRFADLVVGAASYLVQTRPVKERPDLLVLAYNPSILIEVAFLDDPEDLLLIKDEAFMKRLCGDLAFTLVEAVRR